MKKKLVFILTAIVLCLCFVFSACGEAGGKDKGDDASDGTYYTVTFDSQGGSAVDSQKVFAGNPAVLPPSPTRNDDIFLGWFRSAGESAAQWNFSSDRVNENVTLYAHWAVNTEDPTASVTFERNAAGTGFIVTGAGQEAKIVIPETHDNLPVVEIGESAFAYSRHKSDITSVTIPDSVTKIGLNAFYNQAALETVNIGTGSKLETVENNAFSGNSALKGFYLPAGATSLGDSVFNNCGALDSFTVAHGNTAYSGEGNNLIDLASHTILRCTNNSKVPSSVTGIGVAAFRSANRITELYLPRSVKTIDKYAFADSTITTIRYEGSETEWGEVQKGTMWDLHCTIEVEYNASDEAANILVAYFSATGHTETIAGYIAELTGGTKYEIVPEIPYTDADLNYGSSSSRTSAEDRDLSARPEISGGVQNMDSYDVVFLGYPIWFGSAPKIIYTFLESYNFSGKTIIPFCTSASSSMGSSASDLHGLTDGAIWQSGMRFAASSTQSDVESWLNGLNA